jgi:ABC-type glutathione transport system ATPase component
LSTIRHADQILVLEGGRLVEQGSHQALIDRNGIYTRLVNLQSVEAAPPPAGDDSPLSAATPETEPMPGAVHTAAPKAVPVQPAAAKPAPVVL